MRHLDVVLVLSQRRASGLVGIDDAVQLLERAQAMSAGRMIAALKAIRADRSAVDKRGPGSLSLVRQFPSPLFDLCGYAVNDRLRLVVAQIGLVIRESSAGIRAFVKVSSRRRTAAGLVRKTSGSAGPAMCAGVRAFFTYPVEAASSRCGRGDGRVCSCATVG
jgi:hypothetical protein